MIDLFWAALDKKLNDPDNRLFVGLITERRGPYEERRRSWKDNGTRGLRSAIAIPPEGINPGAITPDERSMTIMEETVSERLSETADTRAPSPELVDYRKLDPEAIPAMQTGDRTPEQDKASLRHPSTPLSEAPSTMSLSSVLHDFDSGHAHCDAVELIAPSLGLWWK
jgi:hypothetical protein